MAHRLYKWRACICTLLTKVKSKKILYISKDYHKNHQKNHMIHCCIMRDPGSYEDIIDILIDEKVIPSDEEKMYKEIIRLRNMLVKEYMQVDHKMLQNTVLEHKEVLDHFSAHIRTYLTNETGVANAFSNES